MSEAEPDETATPEQLLDAVYEHRFGDADAARKDAIWQQLGPFVGRYVPSGGRVLDVACDRGYFIRNVPAREKWATDVRDVSGHLPADIRFVQVDGLRLHEAVPLDHFDAVFMSNYLEHLPSAEMVIRQLEVAHCVLAPGGRLIVLQPNARLVGGAYWNFIDHKVALTDRSLTEAAELAGFRTIHCIARFLPYTTKSRLPQNPALVRAYLAVRPLWWIFGKQTLYVGIRA
ncbi:MAG: class I SAM-dependent methyltransferase [Gaiellaceae bacterium]